MKKAGCSVCLVGLFSFFLMSLFPFPGFAQEIIDNPEKPLSKNAGRMIQLQEVLRIKDEGKGFYFKLPWELDVGPDGSIFVQDGLALYEFAPDGHFKKNLVKTGQGPGEISTELTDLLVKDNEVLIFSAPSNKLVKTDFEGKLIKELKFDKKIFYNLLAFHGQKYFMLDIKRRDFARTDGIKDRDFNLFLVNEEGAFNPTSCSFTTQFYLQMRDYGGGRMASVSYDITHLYTSKESQKFMYVAHTQEYQIKQLDLEKAAITKIFRRSYPRAKNIKKDSRDTRKMPEYDNDVYKLLVHKDQIWALTSMYDPKKGILVDVFNPDGKYVDNFWLPLLNIRTGDHFSQRYFPVVIQGDYLYAIEHDADWNFFIAKYKIFI
jgi:hypothetical protein